MTVDSDLTLHHMAAGRKVNTNMESKDETEPCHSEQDKDQPRRDVFNGLTDHCHTQRCLFLKRHIVTTSSTIAMFVVVRKSLILGCPLVDILLTTYQGIEGDIVEN